MSEITFQQLTGLTDEHISWLTPTIGIHKDMQAPLQAMIDAAKLDGIEIEVASGFRSFERQKAIWNRKILGEINILDINEKPIINASMNTTELINAIMLFSALPGSSRHHWGTDIDVYSPNMLKDGQTLKLEVSEYSENGAFSTLTQWLKVHALRHGFCFPYSTYQGGVAAEPWHISYLPLSSSFEREMTISILRTAIIRNELEGKAEILANLEALYHRFIASAFQTAATA